jgi:uncharacterized protein (TIGR02757 family)
MGRRLGQAALKELLESAYEQYAQPDFIPDDPISIPHRFTKKEDIEIAGFLAATIAWGQRKTIIQNASRLLDWMDNDPYRFILNHSEQDLKPFTQFVHRTFNATDALYFIHALHHCYTQENGLEAMFTSEDGERAYARLVAFHERFFSLEHPARTRKHVSNPAKGSSAKRLNMFLRWMVRSDHEGIDFGIWKSISPADLMMPLDVHTGTQGRKLGLLQRKQNDWKAVVELTDNLRSFDLLDPVRFDFALFGMGVVGEKLNRG